MIGTFVSYESDWDGSLCTTLLWMICVTRPFVMIAPSRLQPECDDGVLAWPIKKRSMLVAVY